MAVSNMTIFSGNANPGLALQAANRLKMALGKISVGRFSDGKAMVESPALQNFLGSF